MPRKKIAILQHDSDNAELSKLLLEPLDCELQVFDCGADAIVAIKAYRPDVLLMDLRPHLEFSWSILERLVENADTIHLPVVVVTTLERDARQILRHANVAEVLLAPFDIDELEAKVRAAIKAGERQGWWRDREAMGA